MTDFDSLIVERDGPVLTVRVVPLRISLSKEVPVDIHRDLGLFFDELRHTYDVRVIVFTGAEDGEFICAPPAPSYGKTQNIDRLVNPAGQWATFMGLIHTHQAMVDLEIPIIAKVNGDAIGFGQSLMFACDLIFAREDAKITDMHLAMGGMYMSDGRGPVGIDWGTVPGDGAGSLVPLYMSPAVAKEYLMLSRQKTAAELAQAGIINRAVPAADLDAAVDELVQELLARPPYALGWTKRVVNTRMKDHMLRSLDLSVAYEMINYLQRKLGGAPGGWEPERPDAVAD
jgi:enoyl-CoA hydratase/carnithine racemase